MRKMLFLALALTALIGALAAPTPVAASGGGSSCPICTTYSDGSQCCVSCWCDKYGNVVACTDHYCPPDEPLN